MTSAYQYRAATLEGALIEGVLRAPSERAALAELRRRSLYPVQVERLAEGPPAPRIATLGRASALALFARTVATLLAAGMPLERALAFAARQAGHPDVATAAGQVLEEVRGGAALAQAMARHPRVFGSLFTAMIAAGEESGALDDAMARVADYLDELVELRSQIRSALLYPCLMAAVSGTGIAVLLLFVVPRFAAMMGEEGAALPLSTRLLVGGSGMLVAGWWWLLLAGVGIAAATRSWLARPEHRRRLHAWRLTWPLVGEIEAKQSAARFTRALGMLLGSGQATLPALRAAKSAVGNLDLGMRLDRAVEAVGQGETVHAALAPVLPPLAAELIAVGEESGRLDDLCLMIAETFEREVRRSLRTLVGIVEPALILLFGVVVGGVALAMLQAIYGVNATLL